MVYKIEYTVTAIKDLDILSQDLRSRILKKVKYYSELPDPFKQAKRLQGELNEFYRFRVGDYRVVFRPDAESNVLVILVVLRVAHRKEVYK